LESERISQSSFAGTICCRLSTARQSRSGPVCQCGYIIRFENLAEDFRTLCATLRHFASDITALQLLKPRTLFQISKYYDDELREFVRTRFAAEIERFGYTFEEQ